MSASFFSLAADIAPSPTRRPSLRVFLRARAQRGASRKRVSVRPKGREAAAAPPQRRTVTQARQPPHAPRPTHAQMPKRLQNHL